MHARGIRHQEIKPSNIVCCRCYVYFTDFSSSLLFEIGQRTSTDNPAVTTMIYRAPKVDATGSYTVNEMNEKFLLRYGRGTDVFSLGCVFVEMPVVLAEESLTEFYQSSLVMQKSITLIN
jgi:serine/threonine protein kinase